ncbi:MAG: peptide-methionine (S)-S-oxide reductase MsrA [Patescibacteria group bacterium]
MTKEVAVFGGGCFWCTEAVFKILKGVYAVLPGYSGGTVPNPTYEEVCSGTTGHVEVVYIEFNPQEVSYKTLLTVFFGSHDPTTVNRQGNDIGLPVRGTQTGSQYRSVIFYTTPEQKEEAEEFIKEINDVSKKGAKVVTDVEPLDKFYEAENYHKDYFAKNPGNSYCETVINPKLEKVKERFASLLRTRI